MKPPLLLFLLVVQVTLILGIECFSEPNSSSQVVPGRGLQGLYATVGLHGDRNGEEPPRGKIAVLSRKGGSGSGFGGSRRGGSGKGAPGSGSTDISHKPRTKVSATPSASSDHLLLLILGLAWGALL